MTKKGIVMKQRFILFRRTGVFYCEDTTTRKQTSLHTKDRDGALRVLHARNEAELQPAINLQIARAYLTASDPQVATRNWQFVMDEAAKLKEGPTSERWTRAMRDMAFDSLRKLTVLETRSVHFLRVLENGTVCTNIFLRRLQNFALDMSWLPWPVLPKKRWPKIQFKEKRGITWEEHQKILAGEGNPELHDYYELLWHLAPPASVCTQTYLVAGPLTSRKAAASLQSYTKTRFFRFLVSIRKITQHALRSTYSWVPQQTWNRTWTDEALYAKYGITRNEQAYIESQIRPMNLDDADDE